MASLTTCLKQASDLLGAELRATITKRAEALRKEGKPHDEASRQAVSDAIAEHKPRLAEVESAMTEGRTLYESPPPDTPAAKAESEAEPTRVQQMMADRPDMMVQMDGMDVPMRLADFMAAVKSEADAMAADAPLLKIAAECALLNGL